MHQATQQAANASHAEIIRGQFGTTQDAPMQAHLASQTFDQDAEHVDPVWFDFAKRFVEANNAGSALAKHEQLGVLRNQAKAFLSHLEHALEEVREQAEDEKAMEPILRKQANGEPLTIADVLAIAEAHKARQAKASKSGSATKPRNTEPKKPFDFLLLEQYTKDGQPDYTMGYYERYGIKQLGKMAQDFKAKHNVELSKNHFRPAKSHEIAAMTAANNAAFANKKTRAKKP